MVLFRADSIAVYLTIKRSALPSAWRVMQLLFCKTWLSKFISSCLFLELDRNSSFFNVTFMLAEKVTIEPTFPAARRCCVMLLVDTLLHPSKTTIASPYFFEKYLQDKLYMSWYVAVPRDMEFGGVGSPIQLILNISCWPWSGIGRKLGPYDVCKGWLLRLA